MEEQTQNEAGSAVRIARHYPVAPEKVWRAWTEPQALSAWFGGRPEYVVKKAALDVRPGGRYRIVFGPPDGEGHEVSGVYEKVEVNRKLVFSWAWKGTPEAVSRVGITLTPSGSGCDVLFVHDRFPNQAERDGHDKGWQGAFAKLDNIMEG